jgi:hypothetical protein
MNNLEKELKKMLKSEPGLDPDKSQFKQKETVQMKLFFEKFTNNIKYIRTIYYIFLIVCVLIMCAGVTGMQHNTGRYIFFGLFMALVGYNSTILMKLWYWVLKCKLDVLKEIKQLQLQIAELAEKKSTDQS